MNRNRSRIIMVRSSIKINWFRKHCYWRSRILLHTNNCFSSIYRETYLHSKLL